MIKRIPSLALALIFVICLLPLSGCHGTQALPSFELPDEFDTSKHYEISFWAKNDTNKTQVGIYEKAIRDFEALYPNITVNLRLYTDYSKIYNDVITNISTQTTPNICITYPDHIATYLNGVNVVVPLDRLMDDPSYGLGGRELRFDSPAKDQIIPQFLSECAISGQYYALPYMRSTEACYINKTLIEKLGYTLPDVLTWDFVWEVSEAAMAKDADGNFLANGQKVMIPFIYKSTDNMMIQMLRQLDAPFSDRSGDILIFNNTTRELLKGIAAHAKTGAFSTFKISSYPANFLNAGQCIFAVDSTAGATWMGTNAPLTDISPDKLVDFETVVMMIPQFDIDHPQMISQGPSMCLFNKEDPQEVLASWLFAQYMLTNEVQIAYSSTEGYIPVTSKAHNSEEYQEYLSLCGTDNREHYDIKIKASQLLLDHTEDTFVTPVFSGSASLRDASGQMIESVTKSVRRKEVVDDQYISDLFADMTSLFRLDNGVQNAAASAEKNDLGPIPSQARLLLGTLAAVWICIIVSVSAGCVKKKSKRE